MSSHISIISSNHALNPPTKRKSFRMTFLPQFSGYLYYASQNVSLKSRACINVMILSPLLKVSPCFRHKAHATPIPRVTMLWAAHPDACGGSGGLRSLFANDRAAWRQILDRFGPKANAGKSPDLFVFNSGLHDMQLGFELDEYLDQLKSAITDLKRISKHVVWKRCVLCSVWSDVTYILLHTHLAVFYGPIFGS